MNEQLYTTLGEYEPTGFFTRTWYSEEDIRKGMPGSPTQEKYWFVWSTILHEWCHHLQVVGTTYGRFHFQLCQIRGSMLAASMRELLNMRNTVELHRPLLKDFLNHIPDLDSEHLNAYARADVAIRSLFSSADAELSVNLTGVTAPMAAPCPQVQIDDDTFRLGARHVLEGHAHFNEVIHLIMNVSQPCYTEALNRLYIRDPYCILHEYVGQELNVDDEILTRIVCDIALNPAWPDDGTAIQWEDFHPGWRATRIVEALRDDPELRALIPKEMDWDELPRYARLNECLYTGLGWMKPEQGITDSESEFPWYVSEVLMIRRNLPLAFALPIEHLGTLQSAFPVSADRYTPDNPEVAFETKLDGPTAFEARRYMSLVYENTTRQLLHDYGLRCPIHDVELSTGHTCPETCHIKGFFRAVFGITVEEYLSLPKRES